MKIKDAIKEAPKEYRAVERGLRLFNTNFVNTVVKDIMKEATIRKE